MDIELNSIDFYDSYKSYNSNGDYFKCFVRSTCFASLKHYPNFTLHYKHTTGEQDKLYLLNTIKKYENIKSLFLLDIPGTKALELSDYLYKELNFKSIITFKNLLHPFGIVGNRDFISNLLLLPTHSYSASPKDYIFLLDYNRYGSVSQQELREKFDNQYELNYEDLPNIEMLKYLNYELVVYIGHENPKEDVVEYFKYLSSGEIQVIKETGGFSNEIYI